jgi:hypothetical protein
MATSKSKPQPPSPSGAPRWTYGLAAIVGAAGLIWAIVSHFVPKVEPAKPAQTTIATPTPAAPAVTVSGSGSVGVGTMSGGSISVGQSGSPPSVPASAAK